MSRHTCRDVIDRDRKRQGEQIAVMPVSPVISHSESSAPNNHTHIIPNITTADSISHSALVPSRSSGQVQVNSITFFIDCVNRLCQPRNIDKHCPFVFTLPKLSVCLDLLYAGMGFELASSRVEPTSLPIRPRLPHVCYKSLPVSKGFKLNHYAFNILLDVQQLIENRLLRVFCFACSLSFVIK